MPNRASRAAKAVSGASKATKLQGAYLESEKTNPIVDLFRVLLQFSAGKDRRRNGSVRKMDAKKCRSSGYGDGHGATMGREGEDRHSFYIWPILILISHS